MSQASPTGYDNRDRATGGPVAEVYLYDAPARRLVCASCEPSGARPVGFEYHPLEPGSGGLVGGGRETWIDAGLVAANVPGWTQLRTASPVNSRHQPRYLSNSGRLFFNSGDASSPRTPTAPRTSTSSSRQGWGAAPERSPPIANRTAVA